MQSLGTWPAEGAGGGSAWQVATSLEGPQRLARSPPVVRAWAGAATRLPGGWGAGALCRLQGGRLSSPAPWPLKAFANQHQTPRFPQTLSAFWEPLK